MKWNDARGSYKVYISLGATCQTAYQLRRLGLRSYAGPLDWFISETAHGLIQLLNNRFHGFMEFKNLQFMGNTDDCFIIRDNKYSVTSYHDFPRSFWPGRWTDDYPRFKETVNRRVNRFVKTLNTLQTKPILFIRTQTTKKEAQELYAALNNWTHQRSHLLIVNNHVDDRRTDVVYEDWGFNHIFPVIVPKGYDWRGVDGAWDKIMQGLKSQDFSIRR